MNSFQNLWWKQAKSDHDTFLLLMEMGSAECHLLHFLQMATEKLAKAYFWRSGSPPPKSHAGFVQFLRFLGQAPQRERKRIANQFSFKRFDDFQKWMHAVLPIAYDLERITPDLANDGPNPEYPWPHTQPSVAPVTHQFSVWKSLKSSRGRDLMRFIETAVRQFANYADV